MNERIDTIVGEIGPTLIQDRRDFHHHAETGWCEFRTASLVARRLAHLGYKVQIGREVLRDEERMGLPAPEMLEARWQRAREQGADEASLEAVRGGFTGVVGTLGQGSGPTVALRFDMDALEMPESRGPEHRPAREGFASVNEEATHACAHDAHTAIGLGLAAVLARLREQLRGWVKLIFQPAEEGVRGARAMVAAGVVDDIDTLLGLHLVSGWATGEIASALPIYSATHKFDAFIEGESAHAGGKPQGGKNALLAAATAVLNLYAIPRHRGGATRINVGRLVAGTGRNVICSHAQLLIETRGVTDELSEYMHGRAVQVLKSAAAMYDCDLEIRAMGSAPTATCDRALAERVEAVAGELGGLTLISPEPGGGSEDLSYMMKRVQERGGVATRIGIGADFHGIRYEDKEGHEGVLSTHTPDFDIDENALSLAVRLLAAVVLDLTRRPAKV